MGPQSSIESIGFDLSKMLHLLLLLLLHTPFLLVTSAEHLAPAEAPVHHHYRYIHRRDHPKHHGYVHPPVKPPTYPPPAAHPPPYELPHHRVWKPVAVQGVVFCKSCNYTGVDTLLGASPLSGAEVVLKCRDIFLSVEPKAITDKNGYFFLEVPDKINSYRNVEKCSVFLAASSPHSPCQLPTDLHRGLVGAVLLPDQRSKVSVSLPFTLYDVGPFAYEPPKCKH
ncbi:hypothetical protein Droror1_Dr00020902 [Drosera rotundifolia]